MQEDANCRGRIAADFGQHRGVRKDKEMENKTFEEEIDLVWLFYALFRKLWLIIAVAVLFAFGMAGYTYFKIEPTYTSSSTMLVLTKETTLTSLADLQLGSQLTKDYTILITSRPVLDQVIENLDLDMNYNQLKKKVTINNPEDTRILSVAVTMNNPEQAKAVVDELASVSSTFIGDKMEVAPPKVIEEGEVTGTKTGPNLTKNIMIGFLAGALLVCVIVVVLELMNDSVQTEEDVEKYLEIPTLAIVPDKVEKQKKEKSDVKKILKRGKAK